MQLQINILNLLYISKKIFIIPIDAVNVNELLYSVWINLDSHDIKKPYNMIIKIINKLIKL